MKPSVAALTHPESNTSMPMLIAEAKRAEKRAKWNMLHTTAIAAQMAIAEKTPMAINARTLTITIATPIAIMAITAKAQTAPVPRKCHSRFHNARYCLSK
ncbi:hypothetical protein DSO57_1031884 [Entomophthora muscae]|uniref:Uncharacterized protein n=1 Tax=Entomophthora muscae TaxID=34485 RepID=A0ACC2SD48_9FUNG|nr:hypothetical protein DSO57_1031884 [Entomophthora muscae]